MIVYKRYFCLEAEWNIYDVLLCPPVTVELESGHDGEHNIRVKKVMIIILLLIIYY